MVATCRYLETVGTGRATAAAAKLIALHDQITRCDEALPLAEHPAARSG